ncbi:MAG: hypothetical protein H9535_15505, partial [Ignavibacteria bacterium]|nr:hypothetical protein [Ignavibacteria bacterium]
HGDANTNARLNESSGGRWYFLLPIHPKFLTFRPKDIARCFRFVYFQVSQQENFQP